MVDGTLLVAPDEDGQMAETVLFHEGNNTSPHVISYLRNHGAINCLFVKVIDTYIQCRSIYMTRT